MRRLAIVLGLVLGIPVAQAMEPVPDCRMDDTYRQLVADTLTRAIGTFAALSEPLAFDAVSVNPRAAATSPAVLQVYVIKDASADAVTARGCIGPAAGESPARDPLSVRGGCVAIATERNELRCSARAISVFAGEGQEASAHPALLYVLAHELAHLRQRRSGEFSGRVLQLPLARDRAAKIEALRRSCDPVSTRREEEADAAAVQVMAALLGEPPYRQPVFSERGSMYWAIDQMALAADAWQQVTLEDEDPGPPVHSAFVPTEFPTPPEVVAANARAFVCEALVRSQGTLSYPAPAMSHPPAEQRLRRIAEALKPVADALSDAGGHRDFQPVVRLQNDLGPIFAMIYRETGAYMAALQDEICAIVNDTDPAAACR